MAKFAIVRLCTYACAFAILAGTTVHGVARAEEPAGNNPAATAPLFDDDEATSWHNKTAVEIEPAGEHWIGFEGYRRAASLYSGITWSPFGNLRQDGPRLRLIAGQSIYTYAGGDYTGQGRFTDILAGWQFSQSGTTVKVFGGASRTSNLIAPYDPSTKIQGTAQGIKGVLEIWHNWTSRRWTAVDLAFSNIHGTATAQLRSGWRLDDAQWSAGPELSLIRYTDRNLNVASENLTPRAGLFIRFENLAHEFTISGGVSRPYALTAGHPATSATPMGYGTAQYLRRF